jgi:hypothetical protein
MTREDPWSTQVCGTRRACSLTWTLAIVIILDAIGEISSSYVSIMAGHTQAHAGRLHVICATCTPGVFAWPSGYLFKVQMLTRHTTSRYILATAARALTRPSDITYKFSKEDMNVTIGIIAVDTVSTNALL